MDPCVRMCCIPVQSGCLRNTNWRILGGLNSDPKLNGEWCCASMAWAKSHFWMMFQFFWAASRECSKKNSGRLGVRHSDVMIVFMTSIRFDGQQGVLYGWVWSVVMLSGALFSTIFELVAWSVSIVFMLKAWSDGLAIIVRLDWCPIVLSKPSKFGMFVKLFRIVAAALTFILLFREKFMHLTSRFRFCQVSKKCSLERECGELCPNESDWWANCLKILCRGLLLL